MGAARGWRRDRRRQPPAALYAALSLEQKLNADALMPGGMAMRMGAMKMGGMHGGK